MENKEMRNLALNDEALENVSGGRSANRVKPITGSTKKVTCPACGINNDAYYTTDGSNQIICVYCRHQWDG